MQSLYQRFQPLMIRVATLICIVLVLMGQSADVRFAAFADPEGGYDVAVIEHLRLSVPEQGREAWLWKPSEAAGNHGWRNKWVFLDAICSGTLKLRRAPC